MRHGEWTVIRCLYLVPGLGPFLWPPLVTVLAWNKSVLTWLEKVDLLPVLEKLEAFVSVLVPAEASVVAKRWTVQVELGLLLMVSEHVDSFDEDQLVDE